jgi:molecular chaperone GrpE
MSKLKNKNDVHHDGRTVAELESQIVELTEALKRERADTENIRRRHEEQITTLRNVAKANVVRSLLPVVDNLERSLKHIPADIENHDYVKGVKSVVKLFEKTLGQLGVQRIKTVDEVFDPRFHEAISMEEGDGSQEIITEELQAGYVLGDEVIRHAMVKVKMK